MGVSNEAVVRVFAGVNCAHPIKLTDQHSGKQMVYSERIVGMPGNNLLEILHCCVVFKIVVVVEGRGIQRVRGS